MFIRILQNKKCQILQLSKVIRNSLSIIKFVYFFIQISWIIQMNILEYQS